MKKQNCRELTPKEERELLMGFERLSRACDGVTPPAPSGEFERIIAEMRKRNIIPQVQNQLIRNFGVFQAKQ